MPPVKKPLSTDTKLADERSMLENVPVCAKVVDRNLKLRYMSKAGVEGLGIDDITLYYGKPYPLEFYPDEFRQDMICKLEKARASGEPDLMEGSVLNRHGDIKWYESTITPVQGNAGAVEYFNVVSIDTTERHLAKEALLRNEKKLQALASDLVLAEEKERKRIADHLHEDVSQNLMYIKMMLSLVAEQTDQSECAENLKKAYDVLGLVLSDLRLFSFDLGSPDRTELGLETAIANWVTDRIEKNSSISTGFTADPELKPLDSDVESLLFRSVKELLTNAVRHSQARKIVVKITKEGDMIRISVSDDGIGFSLQLTEGGSNHKGLGLYSIRERMAQMGGSFELESSPDNGCEAVLRAPLKKTN